MEPSYFHEVYRGKRVFVTGHTGFKGAWLTEWLLTLGADVTGYSLDAPSIPALSDQLGISSRVRSIKADIRDGERMRSAIMDCQPDFVFHLAAQALVRRSYQEPIETFDVNVLGTVRLLEALRSLSKACSAVLVTTDKCYENREWVYGYRENDPLGGHDPYSASKAAAEIATASYRTSFFSSGPIRISSARAGNVIGGGDWAQDRIVPDCIRALSSGNPIHVRNRNATRPWQHVLEPLSGYLLLAARLSSSPDGKSLRNEIEPSSLASAFNFGPSHEADRSVEQLVLELLKHWPGSWTDGTEPNAPHEAGRLKLSTDKAHEMLHWEPVWGFSEAVAASVEWYRSIRQDSTTNEIRTLTQGQITAYAEAARIKSLCWSMSSTP